MEETDMLMVWYCNDTDTAHYVKMSKDKFDEYCKLNSILCRNSLETIKIETDTSKLNLNLMKLIETYSYNVCSGKLEYNDDKMYKDFDISKEGEIEIRGSNIYVHISGQWNGKETADEYADRLIKKAQNYYKCWLEKLPHIEKEVSNKLIRKEQGMKTSVLATQSPVSADLTSSINHSLDGSVSIL